MVCYKIFLGGIIYVTSLGLRYAPQKIFHVRAFHMSCNMPKISQNSEENICAGVSF